ncbi:hypothetical protein BDA96_02G267900 [Sorghum bicolor]|uniref:Uncharacterized protein n=2 Tax=Sorghum bicolor TaxID=4558 RepID=A0A921RRX3_SORBI|nr:uncharacterized protein LOC8058964 [Sorghum bicolor]EER97005.1 hypothetical protein SORBI_3002G255800 [Sorghum bicolor]KAG0544350.1 hypothetical protein BDA96_02G267900 [Sorghum bicolor]|eukprot:XP_002460484.1 uncharacterized protein LOC8058964 [Sorghum bicolor]
MGRRSNKRKLEKACGAGDSVPCHIARISSYDTVSPSIYLVVGHQISHPAYSVYKVNPFADGGGGGGDSAKRIRRLKSTARLYAKHCMAFVPLRSKHGPWIVGVGGDIAEDYGPETIVFDTKTQQVITGPKLLSTKLCPVLLTVGSKIYALSRSPNVNGEIDFVPWFEVLDLSQAQVVDGRRLVNCEWKEMPRPPFFPWELTPRQYMFPPEITVESYVAVGSCILVSVTGRQTAAAGTHMFDTETEQWVKLDDKGLPFIRGAIPHGPLLFLGLSPRSKEFTASKEITAYKIKTVATGCPSLSIDEFPMATDCEVEEELVSSSKFVSLGDHSFCSFDCRSISRTPGPQHMGELVSMRAYTIENPLSLDRLKHGYTLLVSNHWKQVYSVRDTFRGLPCPCLEGVIYL